MAVNYRILVINMYTYRLQSRTTHEVLIGGNGFIGTQIHIPSKFSFTSDCGHFKFIRFKEKDTEIPKFMGDRPPRF